MDEFTWFMDAFHALTGIDLSKYKRPQMERRLTNLRDRRGFSDFPSYISALGETPALLDEILDKMTINVSEFFRNPERWTQLGSLLQFRKRPIRAWSAACATGEEPYSLAMLLTELKIPYECILATDIDERVLASARRGVYHLQQLRGTDNKYIDKYLMAEGAHYRVNQALCETIQFRRHNLLRDTYPGNLNLIICRNVLIYFTDSTKQQILNQFADALEPGGLLFVGSTEQFFGLDLSTLKAISPFIYERV